jgi:ABC-2 type transport system ATP-binding protein
VIAGGAMIAVATPEELGGRDGQDATVSWLGPDGHRSVRTATPTELVTTLRQEFGGGEVPGLTVRRPTLEDVYLGMIGTSREEAA